MAKRKNVETTLTLPEEHTTEQAPVVEATVVATEQEPVDTTTNNQAPVETTEEAPKKENGWKAKKESDWTEEEKAAYNRCKDADKVSKVFTDKSKAEEQRTDRKLLEDGKAKLYHLHGMTVKKADILALFPDGTDEITFYTWSLNKLHGGERILTHGLKLDAEDLDKVTVGRKSKADIQAQAERSAQETAVNAMRANSVPEDVIRAAFPKYFTTAASDTLINNG